MYLRVPNNPSRCLEHGSAFNVKTNRMETYEEMWEDVSVRTLPCELSSSATDATVESSSLPPLLNDDASRAASTIASDPLAPVLKKWCVVLRVENALHGVRGVVIRVGQLVQGIAKQKDNTWCERWEYDAGGEVGNWTRRIRLGEGFLPCAVTFEPLRLGVGTKVTCGDFEWVVEELESWD
jgi:hypothetical protein